MASLVEEQFVDAVDVGAASQPSTRPFSMVMADVSITLARADINAAADDIDGRQRSIGPIFAFRRRNVLLKGRDKKARPTRRIRAATCASSRIPIVRRATRVISIRDAAANKPSRLLRNEMGSNAGIQHHRRDTFHRPSSRCRSPAAKLAHAGSLYLLPARRRE